MPMLLKVPVHVSATVALRVPTVHCGESTYTPTPAELVQLSDAERAWLGALIDGRGRSRRVEMTEALVTWPNVCDAIREQMAAECDSSRTLAERELERAVVDASLQLYAAERIPSLRRAGEEKYDVRSAVLSHLADRVAGLRDGAKVWVEGAAYWPLLRVEDRQAPSGHAFEVYDRVRVRLARMLEEEGCPRSVEVKLHRVARLTLPEPALREGRGGASQQWQAAPECTGVVVEICCPGSGKRLVTWRAE
jgi:hypothetical protein